MKNVFAHSLFAAFLLVFLGAGCAVQPEGEDLLRSEGEDNAPSVSAADVAALNGCSAEWKCGSCTTLYCTGQSSCNILSTAPYGVECDGVQKRCQTCSFNGVTYTDGQVVGPASGVHCSSKFDGHCIGGVFAGAPCISSAQCYARCCNGNWSH